MVQAWLLSCLRSLPILLAVCLICPHPVDAHVLSKQECSEGSDFIRNAALSRDRGMSETSFMEVFDDDLVTLKSIPAAFRWFVQDDEDAEFLRAALLEVFRRPSAPERHAEVFEEICLLRSGDWNNKGSLRT